MSTSNQDSRNFVLGIGIISKYRNDEFSISVIEVSSISICGLSRISDQDIEDLKLFGWNAGKDKDGGGWAEYFKLEYVDT
jgi:hypothetical protein